MLVMKVMMMVMVMMTIMVMMMMAVCEHALKKKYKNISTITVSLLARERASVYVYMCVYVRACIMKIILY